MATCTICRHPYKDRIERAVAAGASGRRALGTQFGVGGDAIVRHWAKHVTEEKKAQLKADHLRPGVAPGDIVKTESEGLLDRLSGYRAVLVSKFERADLKGATYELVALNREILRIEELIAKATGTLSQHTKKLGSDSYLTDPRFLSFQASVAAALKPFPEALAAVIEVFQRSRLKTIEALPAQLEALPAEDGDYHVE